MNIENFSSTEPYKRIFSFHEKSPGRLISRESTWLEFKESFNWASKSVYAKSMAAFANNKGGYSVFGVKNHPRNLIGLKNENFDELDEAKIAEYISSVFSPAIKFEKFTIPVDSKIIGIIYVYEADQKPVVCIKNDGDMRESDIYYRYAAQSTRVRYPELLRIMEEVRSRERGIWTGLFERIMRIGPANAAVMNLGTGTVEGRGGSLVIDADLAKRLSFIKEGRFSESGKPTLKLIGDVLPVALTEASSSKGGVGAHIEYRLSDDPNALPVRIEEKEFLAKYKLDYKALTDALRKRYSNFKTNNKYHALRKELRKDKTLCHTRQLDPSNPKSQTKDFFSKKVLDEFDKHYTRVGA